jgi:hypothetical protein
MTVPADVSSAAFLVVAALILPDSEVRIDNVLLNPARTAFLDVLRAMGAQLEVTVEREEPEPVGWIAARTSALHGTTVAPEQVAALIDEVPALAVAAACAEGRFAISGAEELRIKESDRIAALAEGLSRMGVHIEERPDGFILDGGRGLRGAHVAAHDDHRIAMCLAVAALAATARPDRGRRRRRGLFPVLDVLTRASSSTRARERVLEETGLPASSSWASWDQGRARWARTGGTPQVGFLDLDHRIEERTGMSVATLFRERGKRPSGSKAPPGRALHVELGIAAGARLRSRTRNGCCGSRRGSCGSAAIWARCAHGSPRTAPGPSRQTVT